MSVQTLIRACTTGPQTTLKVGDQGPEVNTMRRLLASTNRGFGVAGITVGDIFHDGIEIMIREFQYQVFLTPDGIVGPKTWKALCTDGPVDMPTIRQGDRTDLTEYVTLAQERLANAGYASAAPDGDFGPATHAAVVRFQRAKGLATDGIVGPVTWRALSFAYNSGSSAP
ncbi:MAG: peptidoglycan-binding protein [Cyanobacteria bacterium J06643_4]